MQVLENIYRKSQWKGNGKNLNQNKSHGSAALGQLSLKITDENNRQTENKTKIAQNTHAAITRIPVCFNWARRVRGQVCKFLINLINELETEKPKNEWKRRKRRPGVSAKVQCLGDVNRVLLISDITRETATINVEYMGYIVRGTWISESSLGKPSKNCFRTLAQSEIIKFYKILCQSFDICGGFLVFEIFVLNFNRI